MDKKLDLTKVIVEPLLSTSVIYVVPILRPSLVELVTPVPSSTVSRVRKISGDAAKTKDIDDEAGIPSPKRRNSNNTNSLRCTPTKSVSASPSKGSSTDMATETRLRMALLNSPRKQQVFVFPATDTATVLPVVTSLETADEVMDSPVQRPHLITTKISTAEENTCDVEMKHENDISHDVVAYRAFHALTACALSMNNSPVSTSAPMVPSSISLQQYMLLDQYNESSNALLTFTNIAFATPAARRLVSRSFADEDGDVTEKGGRFSMGIAEALSV